MSVPHFFARIRSGKKRTRIDAIPVSSGARRIAPAQHA
jgi:hypothetical protein